jgi:hypothetical protein
MAGFLVCPRLPLPNSMPVRKAAPVNRGWCALAVWSWLASAAASAAWGQEGSTPRPAVPAIPPVPPAPAASDLGTDDGSAEGSASTEPAVTTVVEDTAAEPPAVTPPEEVFADGAKPPEPVSELASETDTETQTDTKFEIRIGPDDDEIWPKPPEFSTVRWWPNASATTWLVGRRDRFGIFSLTGTGAYKLDKWPGLSLTSGHGFHFLDGPVQTDMPSKVFDFHWGLHWGGDPADGWYADLALTAGVYSDFEDSARDGWRFPSHAVLFYELTPEWHPVLGVKHFDRQNLGPLPVAGVVVKPADELRLELLFPEPRLAWRVNHDESSEQWLTLSGEIGGGEWAIERSNTDLADVVTYNDYRLVFGFHHFLPSKVDSAFEIGYVFARDLEYRSGVGDYSPPETFFLRWTTRH